MPSVGLVHQGMPAWANLVRAKYLAGEASTFVLYGNVFDVSLVDGRVIDLKTFVTEVFAKDTKKTVVEVSPEFGVTTLTGEFEVDRTQSLLEQLHRLEAHLRLKEGVLVYAPYADTLMPGDDAGFVSADDRRVSTLFHRWSLDRVLTTRDNITFIVVESLGSLDSRLLSNPKVSAIQVPLPDEASRLLMVRHLAPGLQQQQSASYAARMSGLRLVQIEGLMHASGSGAMLEGEREALIIKLLEGTPDAVSRAKQFAAITAGLTADEIGRLVEPTKQLPTGDADQAVLRLIHARKRELIEKECAGLIEFIEPKHDLSAVGGIPHIRDELLEIAKNLRDGDTKLSPMGLLGVGPMGAGKTFVIKAFIKEAGLTAVALKNFRSKWVGSTERNLERVLATVKAMGPIAVIVDEGDRSFGNGGSQDGDDGTNSRVIARIKDFMSDTDNRGHVLFILLTNRPDKLDTDIKRPGRCDRKVPFFYAEDGPARATVVKALLRRYGVAGHLDEPALEALCGTLDGYSNADLEALTLLAVEFQDRDPSLTLNEALVKAGDDFMPPQETEMIRFMELLAVSETSRRSLLPARFRDLSLPDIQTQLKSARLAALGHF